MVLKCWSYLKHISICLTMTAAHEVVTVGFYSREECNGRKLSGKSSHLVFVDIFAHGTQKNPCFCGQKIHPYPTMRRNSPWIASRSIIPMALWKPASKIPFYRGTELSINPKATMGTALDGQNAGGCGMDVLLTSKGYKRVLDLTTHYSKGKYRACKYTDLSTREKD